MAKRFGLSVLVSFLVVFGLFYAFSLRGEADQDAFQPVEKQEEAKTTEEKTVSVSEEPSVQNQSETGKSKSKSKPGHEKAQAKSEKRKTASDDGLSVTLKKAKAEHTVASNEKPVKFTEDLKATTKDKITTKDETHSAGTKVGNGKKYSLQIVSNTKRHISERVLKELEEKGFKGYIEEADVKGTPYYRVKLGPVESKDEAEALKMSLSSKTKFSDSLIANE